MRKYKVIKIIIDNPVRILSFVNTEEYCLVKNSTLFLITQDMVKDVKYRIGQIYTGCYKISYDRNCPPYVLEWLENLQVEDLKQQLIRELIRRMRGEK